MPSIVLDREEEMKSQTESVVASVRQDGASAEKGLAASDEPTSPVGKKWFLFGFGVLYMLFLLDFAARLGITAVFPAMQKDLGLSDSQVGVAGSAVLLGMTVFVLPFSFLADKGSKKHAVNLMSAVWGVGCTLCGLVSHLFLIVLGRFMVGIGNASYAPVSVSMLTSWTRRSRWGSVIGAYNSAMSVGLALGTTIAGVLAQHYGWRSAFLAVGGLTLLFTALSLFLPNVKNHVSAASADGKREHVKVREAFAFTLQNKTLILLGIGVGIANMGYTSMISWIPMFMVRIMGWTSTEVGAYMGPAYLITGLFDHALLRLAFRPPRPVEPPHAGVARRALFPHSGCGVCGGLLLSDCRLLRDRNVSVHHPRDRRAHRHAGTGSHPLQGHRVRDIRDPASRVGLFRAHARRGAFRCVRASAGACLHAAGVRHRRLDHAGCGIHLR
ncbi:MAG: MFS transporter [Bilophila wadsworthia]|uniref:MFS transporter n=1 Tax=Bilophila wadsworthia TaxID=35833 RepID=UPI00300F710D